MFYRSFYEAIKDVPKRHRPVIYESVFEYVFEQKEPQLDGIPSAIWKLIRPQIDSSAKRYENAKKGAEYGKMGGRPKKKEGNKKPLKGYETETLNVNVNENVNDNENVNVNVNASGSDENTHTERDSDTQTTDRPSNIAIARTILEEGYPMDAADVQAFVGYNDKLGWKKPLEEALRLWNERKFKGVAKQKPFKNKFQNFERNHDNDELAKKIIQMQLGGNA